LYKVLFWVRTRRSKPIFSCFCPLWAIHYSNTKNKLSNHFIHFFFKKIKNKNKIISSFKENRYQSNKTFQNLKPETTL
jgi:hypothetical protein